MDRKTADQLASLLGGEAWERANEWVVSVHMDDGKVVLFGSDEIKEYRNDDELEHGSPTSSIAVTIPSDEDLWVVVDRAGHVFYENNALERGWRYEEDARHEAMGLQSRTGERYMTVLRSEARK